MSPIKVHLNTIKVRGKYCRIIWSSKQGIDALVPIIYVNNPLWIPSHNMSSLNGINQLLRQWNIHSHKVIKVKFLFSIIYCSYASSGFMFVAWIMSHFSFHFFFITRFKKYYYRRKASEFTSVCIWKRRKAEKQQNKLFISLLNEIIKIHNCITVSNPFCHPWWLYAAFSRHLASSSEIIQMD